MWPQVALEILQPWKFCLASGGGRDPSIHVWIGQWGWIQMVPADKWEMSGRSIVAHQNEWELWWVLRHQRQATLLV